MYLKSELITIFYCPYCGIETNRDEVHCISCGKLLPTDMNERLKQNKHFNRFWYIPILIAFIILSTSITYYTILKNKSFHAKDLYEQGEEFALDENYDEAKELFKESLQLKVNFTQAEVALQFINKALIVTDDLSKIPPLLKANDYQQALSLITKSEKLLKNLQGSAVTKLINNITQEKEKITIEQLKTELSSNPDIHYLKTYLWEAEDIKNDTADQIAEQIREQIVSYIFSKANEQLNNKQYSDAQILIDDGLKYVPSSVKLQSLKTTVEKEKIAFETAQQERIELALDLATKEQEVNKTDAIVLDYVELKRDDQNRLVIKGEVSSVATVPVTSILVEYSLFTNKNSKLLSNKVFVYPDKLFPGEVGKFEFTHYDNTNKNDIEIKVNKIRWYID